MAILIFGLFAGCSKSDINEGRLTNSISTIQKKINADTVILTYDNFLISYHSSSPCFPSQETFYFSCKEIIGNDKYTYEWYFGDGINATGQNVNHSYNNTSQFTILLEIKDSTQQKISSFAFPIKTNGITIKPIAIFSYKQDFNEDPYYLTFNSASSLNHGSIVSYCWIWGDGDTSYSEVSLVRHLFPKKAEDSNYSVKMIVTTDSGCSDDTSVNVWIPGDYNITGDFEAKAFNSCKDEYFVFTPQATNVPTGSIYNWHFSDGKGDTTGYGIIYRFKYKNDYDVIMQVKLNGRTIYTTHKPVSAKGENPSPVASFDLIWKNIQPTYINISLNSKSTISQGGGITRYLWNFGDGTQDDDYNAYIEKNYTRINLDVPYTVTLTVEGNGCVDSIKKTVVIPAK